MAQRMTSFSPDQLNENGETPLYQQIYDLLREAIMSGKAPLNSRLPTEQDLTKRFGVSRITVKRAMNELASAGYVRRQRGLGTVVTYDAAAPTVKASFENMIDGLTRMGLETEVQLLDCSTAPASPAIQETLDLKKGARVQRIVRLRKLEGEPFSYLVTHIPDDVADGYDESKLATESLISLLESAGHRPAEAEQSISAGAADPAVATMLGVSAGSPLLRIHRIMLDKNGRPVQDITAHYRADRFHYQMRLTRTPDADWTTDQ